MEPSLSWIANATGAKQVERGERIQALWGGYGEIFRVHLTGADDKTAIVKWVSPPARPPRSESAVSHARKCRSYEVEEHFYRAFAPLCDERSRVARLWASHASRGESFFLFEDLDAAGFPGRRRHPTPEDTDRCLAWLAAFHARFLGVRPQGLWTTGTYWHLATRGEELRAIEDAELRAAAPVLDRRLSGCRHQTIVHGDAKPENFCFSTTEERVAAVDFQYAGGGCGMKDVAYLLADGGPESVELARVDTYFGQLRTRLAERPSPVDASAVEAEWRSLYPLARADYFRFLAGWAKGAWARDAYGQRVTRETVRALG